MVVFSLVIEKMFWYGLGIRNLVSLLMKLSLLVSLKYRYLWICHLLLKIKLFTWLVMENKILTGDNYQKRGDIGPNICHLSVQAKETINHLMIHCPFTQVVWEELKKVSPFAQLWDSPSIRLCYQSWLSGNVDWKELPLITCWEVWIH